MIQPTITHSLSLNGFPTFSFFLPSKKRILIATIQAEVAHYFGIPVAEMRSARRFRDVARPRQIAMYLAKQLTPQSLPEIGRRFGNRDHTTVIHAIRQVEHLRAIDPELNEDVEALLEALQ